MKHNKLTLSILTALLIGTGSVPGLSYAKSSDIATESNPYIVSQKPAIEVVFVLDTTGSMSHLIHAAKEKIWSIASTLASAQSAPDIKMGLVAFRDRGDNYVTKTIPLSEDLDSMYAKLTDFRADGGGDTPESVNQALYDAVHKMRWSKNTRTYRVVFLVGDAPPHMDYQGEVQYPETIRKAQEKGIVVNAIQAGQSTLTSREWHRVARLGHGRYFQVEQTGNAVAIATPYDDELAELSKQLDKTRIYYGNAEDKVKQQAKVASSKKLHEKSSKASLARRATYNSSKSGKRNFLGDKELVDSVVSGDVALKDIAKEELPAPLQAMPEAERTIYIKQKAEERSHLQKKIETVSGKREAFLKEKVAAMGAEAESSLDAGIFDAIREQAAHKGLVYEKKDAKY